MSIKLPAMLMSQTITGAVRCSRYWTAPFLLFAVSERV